MTEPAPPPPVESSPPAPIGTDDDDALPAVGRVWNNEGPSLSQMMKAAQPAPPEPAELLNVTPIDRSNLPAVWQQVLGRFSDQPSIPALLEGAKLSSLDDQRAILIFPEEHRPMAAMLERGNKKELLRDALQKTIGSPVALQIEIAAAVADAPVAVTRPAPRPTRMERTVERSLPTQPMPTGLPLTTELLAEVQADPLVQAVLQQLGGKVVKITEE